MNTRTDTLRPILRADRAPWWKPILAAVDEGVGLTMVVPQVTIVLPCLAPKPGKGTILYVGDDSLETVGPAGFPDDAMAFICPALKEARHVVIVACAPLTSLYRHAADAALGGSPTVLIECTLPTQAEWLEFMQRYASPDATIIFGSCDPNSPSRPVIPGKEYDDPPRRMFGAVGVGVNVVAPAEVDGVEAEAARREKFLDELHRQMEAMEPDAPCRFLIGPPYPTLTPMRPVIFKSLRDRKRMLPDREARRCKLGFDLASALTAVGL